MPRKRPLDVRIAEHERKTNKLRLEKSIAELRAQMPPRRKRRPRQPLRSF